MSIPVDQLSRIPLVDPCRCSACDGSCQRKVPNKWFMCGSCAKDYHGIPCEAFVESRWPKIVHDCEECGMLRAEH